jgi:hypothetical protein
MQRRQLDFHDFDAIAQDIDRLHTRGYQKVGNWDLAQVCTHLARTMEWSLTGTKFQAPWLFRNWVARKLLVPIVLGRILKKRRLKTGFQAPAELIPSASPAAEAEAVLQCKQLLQRVRDHQGEFCLHPFFVKVTPEQQRQIHFIHSAHHLSFLVPN